MSLPYSHWDIRWLCFLPHGLFRTHLDPNTEIRYFVSLAEVDHLAGALVPHIPDTTFGAQSIAVPRTVQRMPTLRPLLAPGQLASKLARASDSSAFSLSVFRARTQSTPCRYR
jgi:hypothetical protein